MTSLALRMDTEPCEWLPSSNWCAGNGEVIGGRRCHDVELWVVTRGSNHPTQQPDCRSLVVDDTRSSDTTETSRCVPATADPQPPSLKTLSPQTLAAIQACCNAWLGAATPPDPPIPNKLHRRSQSDSGNANQSLASKIAGLTTNLDRYSTALLTSTPTVQPTMYCRSAPTTCTQDDLLKPNTHSNCSNSFSRLPDAELPNASLTHLHVHPKISHGDTPHSPDGNMYHTKLSRQASPPLCQTNISDAVIARLVDEPGGLWQNVPQKLLLPATGIPARQKPEDTNTEPSLERTNSYSSLQLQSGMSTEHPTGGSNKSSKSSKSLNYTAMGQRGGRSNIDSTLYPLPSISMSELDCTCDRDSLFSTDTPDMCGRTQPTSSTMTLNHEQSGQHHLKLCKLGCANSPQPPSLSLLPTPPYPQQSTLDVHHESTTPAARQLFTYGSVTPRVWDSLSQKVARVELGHMTFGGESPPSLPLLSNSAEDQLETTPRLSTSLLTSRLMHGNQVQSSEYRAVGSSALSMNCVSCIEHMPLALRAQCADQGFVRAIRVGPSTASSQPASTPDSPRVNTVSREAELLVSRNSTTVSLTRFSTLGDPVCAQAACPDSVLKGFSPQRSTLSHKHRSVASSVRPRGNSLLTPAQFVLGFHSPSSSSTL